MWKKKKSMLTFQKQHDVGIREVWSWRGWRREKGRETGFLERGLGHVHWNYQACPSYWFCWPKASPATGLYPDLPKEPRPVPASVELEWPLIGMEAVWVSNVLGFLFCFVFWPQNPLFNRNLARQTNVGNTELPLDGVAGEGAVWRPRSTALAFVL